VGRRPRGARREDGRGHGRAPSGEALRVRARRRVGAARAAHLRPVDPAQRRRRRGVEAAAVPRRLSRRLGRGGGPRRRSGLLPCVRRGCSSWSSA
jgi:hypothetical protein